MELEQIGVNSHEAVYRLFSNQLKLEGYLAIHNTNNGPAFGGTRIRKYKSNNDALNDVLRLSNEMTFKSTLFDLPYGGGKVVFNCVPNGLNKEAFIREYAHILNIMKGKYITSNDVGFNIDDVQSLKLHTRYVKGERVGQSSCPATAYGVFLSIKAACKYVFGIDSCANLTVVVQGLGEVGMKLCQYLYEDKARLIVSDIDTEKCNIASTKYQAKIVDTRVVATTQCDVFAPCALYDVINQDNYKFINTRMIIGAANNAVLSDDIIEFLHNNNVCYLPGYLTNVGGVIDVCCEGDMYSPELVLSKTKSASYKVMEILEISEINNVPPDVACKKQIALKISGKTIT
jgi:leucine dehydrogenase